MAHYSKRNRNKKQNNSPQEIRRTITNGQGVEKEVIIKAASDKEVAVSRYAGNQKSYNALRVVGGQIYEEQKKALRYPEAYTTYNKMMYDDAVSLGYTTKRILMWLAMNKFKIKEGNAKTARAKEARDFVDYCFHNFDQTWYDIIMNGVTYSKYGFSLLEMVPTRITAGKYAGRTKFKRFSPISAKSVDEWVLSEDQSRILGIEQSTSYLETGKLTGELRVSTVNKLAREGTEISIPYNRLLHWAYNGEASNPIGESQFKYCYTTWLEKQTISEYECVGVSKDLGGVLEIKLPAEVLNKAALDPSGKEAQIVEKMMTDAANVTANEQAYFLNPSDWHEDKTGPMYSMELKGISGSGKQFDLNQVIQRKRKAILDAFGVGFIALGENGGGSYAQAEAGTSFHGLMLEADLSFFVEPFNSKAIPLLLSLNGFQLEDDEYPILEAGSIDEKNPDVVSKVVQRVFAVNGIPRTKNIIIQIVEDLGLPTDELEDMELEEIWEHMGWNPETNTMQSRSGDGMASGLNNGTGNSSSGRDDSTSNNENSMETSSTPKEWKIKEDLKNGIFLVTNGKYEVQVLEEDLEDWLQQE